MRHGFSLIELSIVLVILGLLTGGILAGQSLIRASEMRSVVTEYQRYISAVNTFRDKYQGTPGDFANATRFWSRAINQAWCVTNSGASVVTGGTCDGNGNGTLAPAGAASQSSEHFQFWNQLALAGLIEGTYSGNAGAGGVYNAVTGVNVPSSKLNKAVWYVYWVSNYAGDSETYAMDYGNYFNIGATQATSYPQDPVMRPEEAWNIDTKMDDGKPAYGKIVVRFWNNACAVADDGTSANNDLVASYKLTDNTLQCSMYFRQAF